MNTPDFDLPNAHRFFSAQCFNHVWELMDKPSRSGEENSEMLACAFASLWHWLQRADCTEQNLSIAFWQISRVHVLLGDSKNAEHFGTECLRHSDGLAPFYLAYAHEALARAAVLSGDVKAGGEHLSIARTLCANVVDNGERSALEADLATIKVRNSVGR